MIEFEISKVVRDKVSLSDEQAVHVTKIKLRKMLWPGEYIVKRPDGTLWLAKDEDNHRHGSVGMDYLHIATKLELAIYEVLVHL